MMINLVWICIVCFALDEINVSAADESETPSCTIKWVEVHDVYSMGAKFQFKENLTTCREACIKRVPGCTAVDVHGNHTNCFTHTQPLPKLEKNRVSYKGHTQLVLTKECASPTLPPADATTLQSSTKAVQSNPQSSTGTDKSESSSSTVTSTAGTDEISTIGLRDSTAKAAEISQIPNRNSATRSAEISQIPNLNSATRSAEISQIPNRNSATRSAEISQYPNLNSATRSAEISQIPNLNSATIAAEISQIPNLYSTTRAAEISQIPNRNSATRSAKISQIPNLNSATIAAEISQIPNLNSATIAAEISQIPNLNSTTRSAEISQIPNLNSAARSAEISQIPNLNSTTRAAEISRPTIGTLASHIGTDKISTIENVVSTTRTVKMSPTVTRGISGVSISQSVPPADCTGTEKWKEYKDSFTTSARFYSIELELEACKKTCVEKITGCVAVVYIHVFRSCRYHDEVVDFDKIRKSKKDSFLSVRVGGCKNIKPAEKSDSLLHLQLGLG